MIQLRCKGWSPERIEAAAREALRHTRAAGALLLLNDHPELAARVGADGVHVGREDTDAAIAREILGPQGLVGVSNNSTDELRRALPHADYVAVGPIYDTPNLSWPKPIRGLELLRQARTLTKLPLVAIGGLTPARVAAVHAAGADSWAVIRGVCEAPDPSEAVRAFIEVDPLR